MPSHYEMLAGQMPQQQPNIQDQFLMTTQQLQQTKAAIQAQQQKEGEDFFVRQMSTYKALVDAGAYNAAAKFFNENIRPIAQNDAGQPVFPSVDLAAAGPEFHKQLSNLWAKGLDKTGRMQNRQALTEAAGRLAQEFPRQSSSWGAVARGAVLGAAGAVTGENYLQQDLQNRRLEETQRQFDIMASQPKPPENPKTFEQAILAAKTPEQREELISLQQRMKQLGAKTDTSPVELLKLSNDVRKTFRSDIRVDNYRIIDRAYQSMAAAAVNAKSAEDLIALDEALVTLYKKMLDPQSVVRESEYARTEEGQSLLNDVKGWYDKLTRGGAGLTAEDRDALVSAAKVLHTIAEQEYLATAAEYRSGIEQVPGLNADKILGVPRSLGPRGEKKDLFKYLK